MIKVKQIEITDIGDLSVGLFPETWEIKGNFEFETEAEINLFKQNLKDFWQENVLNEDLVITIE